MKTLIKFLSTLIVFLILIFFMNCSKSTPNNKTSNLNSFQDIELPMENGFKRIFVLKDKLIFEIFYTDINKMYFEPFNNEFNIDFFLNDFIHKNKLSIEELRLISNYEIELDELFYEKIKNQSVTKLIETFCINDGYRTYINNELANKSIMTLCYVLFNNNYDVGYDCVSGVFVINKNIN